MKLKKDNVADKPVSYYAFEMLYWMGIREGDRVESWLHPVNL